MTQVKRPAFQFYPRDWLGDTALRSCSIAARGLWVDMLAYMHEGEPYGYLRINGRPVTADALSRMVGESPVIVKKLLRELEEAGVFSVEDDAIYSRRMVRDEHIRTVRAEAGSKGGNPNLVGSKHKPPDKGEVKQRPKQTSTPAVASASASAVASALQPPRASAPANGSASPPSPAAPGAAVRRPNWVSELGDDWKRLRLGNPPYGQIGVELKTLHGEHGMSVLRPAWIRFLESPKAQFGVGYFARNLGDFLAPGADGKRSGNPAVDTASAAYRAATKALAESGGEIT